MVNVNIWFIPRSRSTALTRCLSNIPASRVFCEPFQAALVLEKNQAVAAEMPDSENTAQKVIEKYLQDCSDIKIIKEVPLSVKPEFYPSVITGDSINIFLVRHPALVASSQLGKGDKTYFDILVEYPTNTLAELFEKMETVLQYVVANCKNPPLVVPGSF